ncbi:MAG: YggS family pyridoxal phosphate-dependent enzyme [Lachnospiraceae bacterium]|nr:YggS family pyridoxal phosphate-dependent enzyme [Lachnospiraceae bacterium]
MIAENYQEVSNKIKAACDKAGREYEDVTLITVSKTKPVSDLREAYDAGSRDFGENKVQEMMDKIPQLPSDIRWHMIGHLQRNKVKYLIGKVYLIHSVDSVRLAEEISKESVKAGVVTDILVEVNVAGEESKFGTGTEESKALVREIAKFPGIHIKGLMTIAPYVEDPEENREVFKALKKMSEELAAENLENTEMTTLSMGMTGDYEVAVEEGATFVRVGTGIFGERNYNI